MNKYFHEGMTVGELRTTLFTVVEGKTKEEIEEIKKEYSKISSTSQKYTRKGVLLAFLLSEER